MGDGDRAADRFNGGFPVVAVAAGIELLLRVSFDVAFFCNTPMAFQPSLLDDDMVGG